MKQTSKAGKHRVPPNEPRDVHQDMYIEWQKIEQFTIDSRRKTMNHIQRGKPHKITC